MKKFRTALVLLLCLSFLVSTTAFAANDTDSSEVNATALINEYWSDVCNGQWEKWVNHYAPNVRDEYIELISSPQNPAQSVGIFTVDKANVLGVKPVSISSIPAEYSVMIPELLSGQDCLAYVVDVDLHVKVDNGYFKNGLNTFLFTVSTIDNVPYINAVTSCTWDTATRPSLLKKEQLGYGFQDYDSRPTTINVKYKNGEVKNIDFNKYVFLTTCNEIGNSNFNAEAIKAQAIAIQMCGRWAKKGHFFPVGGYDVYYGYVAIDLPNRASAANQKTIRTAVNAVANNEVLSSGGKFFSMNYFAGSANGTGQGSGQMRQNGANYLANSRGYDWRQIIRYYYNHSAYNNNGVGEIKIY